MIGITSSTTAEDALKTNFFLTNIVNIPSCFQLHEQNNDFMIKKLFFSYLSLNSAPKDTVYANLRVKSSGIYVEINGGTGNKPKTNKNKLSTPDFTTLVTLSCLITGENGSDNQWPIGKKDAFLISPMN